MPFDGVPQKSKLLLLRDVIANVPDEEYDQRFCQTCAMGHAYKAGLLSFNPDYPSPILGESSGARACRELGLPIHMNAHFFGWPSDWHPGGGPMNRTEFLARLDAFIAG
jgi:hypothetical protein